MRREGSTLTKPRGRVYTRSVAKKGRQFRMDDDTYAKLTAIAKHFGMRRAAVLRMFIHERYSSHNSTGDL